MGKKDPRNDDKGRVKFRFVEFELDGSNATIEESIRNIVASMTRGASSMHTRQLGARTHLVTEELPSSGKDALATQVEEVVDDEQEGTSDDKAVSQDSSQRQKQTRRYTEPNFLGELDLESGEVPFKDFAQRINPNTDNHRYLVIAAWLKKHRNLDEITIDHIYSCNQAMGWKNQRDLSQPFRYMKRKSYFDHPSKNSWKITFIGMDKVELPDEESQ